MKLRVAFLLLTGLLAGAAGACRPTGLCEAPSRAVGSHDCPAGCRSLELMRDDGDCYRNDSYFCTEENQPFSTGGSCVVDPDGVRHAARESGYLDMLEPLGWRRCTPEEAEGFPRDVCHEPG